MIKRVHHKNKKVFHKLTKPELAQVYFKLNTSPARFDFREQKAYDKYLKKMKELVEMAKSKVSGVMDDETAVETV